MKRTIMTLILALMALMVVGEALPASAAVVKPKAAVYDSIPKNLPGNVPSVGFQANQTTEFGDAVSFAPGTTDKLKQVTVVMNSFACEHGTWNGGDCVTTPGATFPVQVTLRLYPYIPGAPATAGPVFASSTKLFRIAYRPSADPDLCLNQAQFASPDGHCYNGKTRRISFYFADGLTLPNQLVYGVSFDTSGYGLHPKGYDNPCNATNAGCPWDSLNMAAGATAPKLGTDLLPDGTFFDSSWSGAYCDNGAAGTGSYRLDDGCWTGYNPLVRFKVFLG